jgi:hypothetical protein
MTEKHRGSKQWFYLAYCSSDKQKVNTGTGLKSP